MRLLITGSRGFIGGTLGRAAAARGDEVLGVGHAAQAGPEWPGEYVQADVAYADLSGLVRDFAPEAIVHAAGPASVGGSFGAPVDDLRTSLLTWANTLDGVRRSGVSPLLLFLSSAAIYGEPARLPVREDDAVAPISPYGFHKAACELVGREFADCFGLSVLICRIFSVFGPGMRRLLAWELYEQLARPGQTVLLEGTGEESRDYLGIHDVVAALLGLADTRDELRSNFLAVNIGRGEETRIAVLADNLRKLVAPHKTVHWGGLRRAGDPLNWCADVSRLQALLPGWQPRPLEAALAQCAREWAEQDVISHAE